MQRLLELLPLDWLAFLLLLLGVFGGMLFVAALDLPAAFLLLPAAGLGAGFVYLWPSRRRAAAFRRAAARLGCTYVGKGNPFAGDADFDRRGYELLWRPDTTYGFAFRNLMRGTASPGETVLFDFRYGSVEGDRFEQTVAAFSSPGARWPQFSIGPKGILDRAVIAATGAVNVEGVIMGHSPATTFKRKDGTDGKVALVNSTIGLGCNGGSTPCSIAQSALIKDLVGYGTANFYEGAAAPALSNTTAVLRLAYSCTETDNNASDFSAGSPNPRNSSSATHLCGGTTQPTNTTSSSTR